MSIRMLVMAAATGTVVRAYRYWRVYITDSYNSSNANDTYKASLAEASMASVAGGNNLMGYNGLSASSQAEPVGNLLDGNLYSIWVPDPTPLPHWFSHDFVSPIEIKELRMTCGSFQTLQDRAPKTFSLQGSQNNVDWTTVLQVNNTPAWYASEARTFTVPS